MAVLTLVSRERKKKILIFILIENVFGIARKPVLIVFFWYCAWVLVFKV